MNSENEQSERHAEPSQLYQEGMRYLYGLGVPEDYTRASELFRQGWEMQEPNAGYLLCNAYMDGLGVPRDYAKALALAEELVQRGYYPAYHIISYAHGRGLGTPLNVEKAKQYTEQLKKKCNAPMDGVDETLRYEALMSNEINSPKPDWRRYEKLARQNMRLSQLPRRYALYAMSLMRLSSIMGDAAPSLRDELREAINEGMRAMSAEAFFLKGLLLCSDMNIYPQDVHEGMKLIRYAAKQQSTGVAEMWREIYNHAETQKEAEHAEILFWEMCNLGTSRIKRSDELNCHISLRSNTRTANWVLVPENKYRRAMELEKFGKLFALCPPLIELTNNSHRPLNDLSLRICCSENGLDETIKLDETLEMGERITIDPFQLGFMLCDDLLIEVHSQDQFSAMELRSIKGVSEFVHDVVPLLMWWRGGLLSGRQLALQNVGDSTLQNIRIQKMSLKGTDDSRSAFDLAAGETRLIGRKDFNDRRSPQVGDLFSIDVQGFYPIFGLMIDPSEEEFIKVIE